MGVIGMNIPVLILMSPGIFKNATTVFWKEMG